ncbi:MAG: flagellar assembly protein FliW [Thermodesulfobacteria bacterium]|nr:flagellar assembly protein FliW [Thermodesulfobacteriota bacterium]
MKIETTRFGTVEVDENKILNFVRGILGFPNDLRYALLPHKEDSPFFWLQSVDSPDLAFVVVNPAVIVSDYSFELPEDAQEELQIKDEGQAEALVIVSFRKSDNGKPSEMSANLLGPIVINVDKRLAKQVVLDPKKYPVRYEFGGVKN